MRKGETIFQPALDLFGLPLSPDPARGRPPHRPTDTTRRRARELHLQGFPQLKIAWAMKITVPTLTRHYAVEVGSSAARHVPFKHQGDHDG